MVADLPPAHALRLPGRGRTYVYDTGGNRPTVLLLHGWTSTAALNFYRSFRPLSERYRVVALDHRGHGRGIRSRIPFRLEDCADDAAALIDHLGVGSSTVVGYSMGGPIAQLVWQRHPSLVSGLVLCATTTTFPMPMFDSPLVGVSAGALSLVPSLVRRFGMSLATSRWSSNGGAAEWAAKEWSRSDPSALVQAVVALSRFDSSGWIGTIDVPTAVVVTERDMTIPPSRQRAMASAIPGARVFPVDGDHRACVDSPAAFVPALLAACSYVSASAPLRG